MFGFGVPFLLSMSGLLAWVFHSQLEVGGWAIATVLGIGITALCGGTTFVLIGMMMRAGYSRLSRLVIPHNGNDLELDSPEEVIPEEGDLQEGLKWMFLGNTKRHRLCIPRRVVVAVQLCPWKYMVQSQSSKMTTWAVQGLLVLASSEEGVYHRLPLLLTSDFVGAARLMGRLATALHVPYLFCADAEGWRVEEMRARNRPPLQVGGWQT